MSKIESSGRAKPKSSEAADTSELGFSIRVASKMTSIPADTLRMWERRYGFPKPARRPGGSRFYSEQDISYLRLIGRGLQAGYRPHELIGKTGPELEAFLRAVDAPPVASDTGPSIDGALSALAAEDPARLATELRLASVTLGPRSFVTQFAHPLAVRVGELWATGELEIRHEHLATECLLARLHILLSAYEDSTGTPLVILATLPSEVHSLGLALIALYVATCGGTPRILGANTPVDELVEAARALKAQAVGLTLTRVCNRAETKREVRQLLHRLPKHVGLWLGGDFAPNLRLDHEQVRVIQAWSELSTAIDEMRARGT